MKKINSTYKPIQAGDYGKITPEKTDKNDKDQKTDVKANTDGRKTLALWN